MPSNASTNGFVRLRFAPTDVGDYDPVGADVSPRKLDLRRAGYTVAGGH